jgi:opacity protein-like surface antigen
MVTINRRQILHALLVAAVTAPAASAQETAHPYLRAAVGYEASADTRLADRACDATPLLNYFGCEAGEDGEPIGAQGDFGASPGVEVAAGFRVLRYLPVELALSHRPGLDFTGNATFLGAGGRQPVSAEVSQTAVMVRGLVDLGPFLSSGRIEPFVGIGVGTSRNSVGDVAYEFPGLAANPASTTTRGGAHWDPAWDVGAGVAVRVASRVLVEAGYRYSDFGWIETDDGTIEVRRGNQRRFIDNVAGTRAPLRIHSVYVGFRQEF